LSKNEAKGPSTEAAGRGRRTTGCGVLFSGRRTTERWALEARVACLVWVFVFYSREMADRDLKVIAVLIVMLALTGASFLMARFARKRIRTLTDSN